MKVLIAVEIITITGDLEFLFSIYWDKFHIKTLIWFANITYNYIYIFKSELLKFGEVVFTILKNTQFLEKCKKKFTRVSDLKNICK